MRLKNLNYPPHYGMRIQQPSSTPLQMLLKESNTKRTSNWKQEDRYDRKTPPRFMLPKSLSTKQSRGKAAIKRIEKPFLRGWLRRLQC